MKNPNDLKVMFAPGCFDAFEGTQEELNSLIEEITKVFTSGKFLEEMTEVEFDDPIMESLEISNRKLH